MTTTIAILFAAGVTIGLPLETRVRGTEMTLGDVASLSGDDAELVARVAAVPLGYAPAPGYSRLLFDYNIEAAVRRAEPSIELAFAGEAATRVWPTVETLSADAIRAVAQAELARLAGGADVSIAPRGELQDVRVPAGAGPASLRVRAPERELASGVLGLPIEVAVDGTLYRTIWTSWDVQVFDTLPVLARRVGAGEKLTPNLFEARRVEVQRPGGTRSLAQAAVVGAVAARDLPAGAVVTADDVQRPLVVRARDALFLQIRKGPITARVSAVARESGSIGDRIRVVLADSGVELSGVVRTRDLVEIDMNVL